MIICRMCKTHTDITIKRIKLDKYHELNWNRDPVKRDYYIWEWRRMRFLIFQIHLLVIRNIFVLVYLLKYLSDIRKESSQN